MAILKEVMTNEASVLLDSDAANKAADADAALQELGTDQVGQAYVTATVTVWDEDPVIAADRLRLVEKTIQGRDFTCMRESVNALEAWFATMIRTVWRNISVCARTVFWRASRTSRRALIGWRMVSRPA